MVQTFEICYQEMGEITGGRALVIRLGYGLNKSREYTKTSNNKGALCGQKVFVDNQGK